MDNITRAILRDTLERMDLTAKRYEKIAAVTGSKYQDFQIAQGIRTAMAILVDELPEDTFDQPFINYRIPMLDLASQ